MILVLSLLFFIFTKNRAYKNESLSEFSYSPTRPELYSKSIKTNSELQEETAYWENIIERFDTGNKYGVSTQGLFKYPLGQ